MADRTSWLIKLALTTVTGTLTRWLMGLMLLSTACWLGLALTAKVVSASDGLPVILAQAQPGIPQRQGNQVMINGRTWPIPWIETVQNGVSRFNLSDAGLMRYVGLELLNTADFSQQPVQWFPEEPLDRFPIVLAAQLSRQFRFLDITPIAQSGGWQMVVSDSTLQITVPPAIVQEVLAEPPIPPNIGNQPFNHDLVTIVLNQPTLWQLGGQGQELTLTLVATADSSLLQKVQPSPGTIVRDALQHRASPRVEAIGGQTVIRMAMPAGAVPQVTALAKPPRLVVNFRGNPLPNRDIAWAPGVRWQHRVVSLPTGRFPIVTLTIDPRTSGLRLRPFWNDSATLVGITPVLTMAQRWGTLAAINAGFFSRATQTPLGAIRLDGRWLSSPILNRGAIGWDDNGAVKIDRLAVQETLVTAAGQRFPLTTFNSGYPQAGIARYDATWGSTYTALMANEVALVVVNNRIAEVRPLPEMGRSALPIPPQGYILTVRANQKLAAQFSVGLGLGIERQTFPPDFDRYAHVIGAGPLLLRDRQIVLDAAAEKFSPAFMQERAVRSAIATTANGQWLVAAMQNRIGGSGPSLTETAQIMQQLGAIDALNLDGGSSTSLYLGGQLVNRSPQTAARVHNSLGFFYP